ncbi:MAG: LEA type 2 family protein [Deltaproteobacteria bacterium]|nr:LEA type 2 family protein [Deltaproteobacteria bacterium]
MRDTVIRRRELLRLVAGAAAVGVVLPSSGCATLCDLLGDFIKAPDLRIKKMDITKMTLTTISTKFLVDLINPNPFGFRLDGLDYLLRLGGAEVSKGSAPKGITLKPAGKATTELDLDFDLGRTTAAVLKLIEHRSIGYELQTVGKFFGKQGGINVPASFKGNMPMPIIPKLGIKSFAPTSVGPGGVAFKVVAEVENTNPFDIPIDGFGFDVKLDGRSVLKNKSVKGVTLKAKKSNNVPFQFDVGLVEVGLSIAELAAGKRLSYEVGSEIESGFLKLPFTHKGSVRVAS